MLNLPTDTLAWIIMKARELDVKDVDTSDGEEDADSSGFGAVLEARGEDSSADELSSWITDLTDTERAELTALFWLGRGDGAPEEFAELMDQARAGGSLSTAQYLMGEPMLADMLEEGLEKLGISVADVESGI